MSKIKPAGYWTKERCYEESLKYKTWREFSKGAPYAHGVVYKNNWRHDLMFTNLKSKFTPHYWTKEEIKGVALRCSSRTEFRTRYSRQYDSAKHYGWLKEVCQHMPNPQINGGLRLRCIYVYEFSDNHIYVGLTVNIKARILNRKNSNRDPVTLHAKATSLQPVLKIIKEGLREEEAKEMEIFYIAKYKEDGWLLLNKHRGGTLGGGGWRHSKKECYKEALKHKTPGSLKEANKEIFNAIKNHGWGREMFSHMEYKNKVRSVSLTFKGMVIANYPSISAASRGIGRGRDTIREWCNNGGGGQGDLLVFYTNTQDYGNN